MNGRSNEAAASLITSFEPETNEATGITIVMFKMFAPMMFPIESDGSFLMIAEIVVTSSGRLVPIATRVTAIILSGTPKYSAILPP